MFISGGRRAVFTFEQCWHPVTRDRRWDWGRGCGGWKGGAKLLLSYHVALPLFSSVNIWPFFINLVLSSILSERGSLKYQTPTPLEGNSQIFHRHQWRLSDPILFGVSCVSSSRLPVCHQLAQYSLKQTHKHILEHGIPSVNAQIHANAKMWPHTEVDTHRDTNRNHKALGYIGIFVHYLVSLCKDVWVNVYWVPGVTTNDPPFAWHHCTDYPDKKLLFHDKSIACTAACLYL